MDFKNSIENLRGRAAEAAQAAAKKTKKLAEIAKANLSIYSEEDKIKKAQAELGKLYYRDYVVGEELDEAEYLPWCSKITECRKKIEALRDEIADCKEKLGGDADELVIVPVEEAYPEEAAAEEAVVEAEEEAPAEETAE